jgi:hypothetical protein
VRRAYSYAASRTIERGERDWIAYLDARFAQDGYRVKDLMRRIATSEALYTIGAAPVMTAAATRQESDP